MPARLGLGTSAPLLLALASLQAAAVPVEFEEHHLSEVQNMASEEKLDEFLDSMKKSKVAIIGAKGAGMLAARTQEMDPGHTPEGGGLNWPTLRGCY